MTMKRVKDAVRPKGDRSFDAYRAKRSIALRNRLVEAHMGLVYRAARKHAYNWQDFRDLVQVGGVALIHAVERYDPDRGVAFATYAIPCVEGEMKRYFRDKAITIKTSRHAYELHGGIRKVVEELTARFGRSPRIKEIAKVLRKSEEEVLESLEADYQCKTVSLETPLGFGQDGGGAANPTLGDVVGADDRHFQELFSHMDLQEVMKGLPKRERLIILLRYLRDYSQAECAKRLHLSQMHVSRLEREALHRLERLLKK